MVPGQQDRTKLFAIVWGCVDLAIIFAIFIAKLSLKLIYFCNASMALLYDLAIVRNLLNENNKIIRENELFNNYETIAVNAP